MSIPPYLEGILSQRMERLLALLNAIVALPGGDRLYVEMGKVRLLKLSHEDAALLEDDFPEAGISEQGGVCYITVASLLATITDVLCGKRLCFKQEDDGKTPAREAKTAGFQWFKDPSQAPPVKVIEEMELASVSLIPEEAMVDPHCKVVPDTGRAEAVFATVGRQGPHGRAYTREALEAEAERLNKTKGCDLTHGPDAEPVAKLVEARVEGDDLVISFDPLPGMFKAWNPQAGTNKGAISAGHDTEENCGTLKCLDSADAEPIKAPEGPVTLMGQRTTTRPAPAYDDVFVCDSCMPGGEGIVLDGHDGVGLPCECFVCRGVFERSEVNAITKASAEEIVQEKAASSGPVCPTGDEGVEGPPGPPEIEGDERAELPGHPDDCYCPLCMAERGKRVRVTCSECEVEFNPNVDPDAAGLAGGPLCPECYKKKREKEADGEA